MVTDVQIDTIIYNKEEYTKIKDTSDYYKDLYKLVKNNLYKPVICQVYIDSTNKIIHDKLELVDNIHTFHCVMSLGHTTIRVEIIRHNLEYTKEYVITELNRIALAQSDPESDHCEADNILISYINDKDIEEAYNRVQKWYS